MNFYVDSGGVVLHVDPERIFQGSANANTIRFVGAFASNLSVTTAFKLPNGVWTVPQKMTLSAQLPGIQMPDGTQFNTWEYKIPATVTENYGAVNVQFFVYGDTGGTGGQIASAMSSFEVEKGVPITLPDPTDDYNTLLTQILSILSQLQGFYDDLNIDLEQLQTSVRGLQGEVSGIQIDLEQVHTDLGNRVEKTTLTYSLYGTDKNGNQAIIPYGTTGLGNSIPQYTADSEIRIPASPTQSYYAANKGYVDAGLEEKLDKTGGPINGDLLVGGELRVLDDTIIIGNLTVHGTTITEDAETIMSKANVIVTNSEGAPLTQLSGIGIRTNATLVYGIMYDPGDDTVRLGEGTLNANNEFTFNSGEGTAVSTRADSALWTNGHLAQWNGAEYRFIDSGIAAGNVVTINTTQQITGQKSFLEPVLSSDSGTSQYTAEYAGTHITEIDEPGAASYTYAFPKKSGIFALTSDIPTDYVTQEEFEKAQRSIEDIYTILGQTVILWQSLTQEYTTRETAAGMDIIDGALTEVKEIRGKTVKTTNEFAITNLANTDYLTVSGTTITVTNRYDCNSLKTLRQLCPNIHAGTYTASVNVSANTALSNASGTIVLYSSDGLLYLLPQHTAGQLKNVFILSNEDLDRPVYFFGMSEGTVTWDKLMILEGDWTNKEDLSYSDWFAGLKNASFEKIVSTGKNLVPYPYEKSTKTENGITFTVNSDGSITANGTTTVNPSIFNLAKISLKAGTYALRSFVNVENAGVCQFYIDIPSEPNDRTGNGVTFTLQDDIVNKNVNIIVNPNQTVNNLIFKPMLQFGTTAQSFEPYKQSVLSLPAPVENPAYNTLDFQTGKNISQGITKVFDGTEGWSIYVPSTGNEEAGYTVFRQNIIPLGISGSIESICNKYPYKAYGYALSTPGPCQSFSSEGQTFFIKQNQYSTIDEWKAYLAAQYAAGDPVMVRYKTAEVQSETDLNASSDRYIAWKGGSETIVQGEVDNSEYGAENTVVQNYATKRGGTTE